jgi:signal transduction histidine kinase
MKHEVEDGVVREAEAQARVLAEEARCERVRAVGFAGLQNAASRIIRIVLCDHARSSKTKDQFVAMVSHEARTAGTAAHALACIVARSRARLRSRVRADPHAAERRWRRHGAPGGHAVGRGAA